MKYAIGEAVKSGATAIRYGTSAGTSRTRTHAKRSSRSATRASRRPDATDGARIPSTRTTSTRCLPRGPDARAFAVTDVRSDERIQTRVHPRRDRRLLSAAAPRVSCPARPRHFRARVGSMFRMACSTVWLKSPGRTVGAEWVEVSSHDLGGPDDDARGDRMLSARLALPDRDVLGLGSMATAVVAASAVFRPR